MFLVKNHRSAWSIKQKKLNMVRYSNVLYFTDIVCLRNRVFMTSGTFDTQQQQALPWDLAKVLMIDGPDPERLGRWGQTSASSSLTATGLHVSIITTVSIVSIGLGLNCSIGARIALNGLPLTWTWASPLLLLGMTRPTTIWSLVTIIYNVAISV